MITATLLLAVLTASPAAAQVSETELIRKSFIDACTTDYTGTDPDLADSFIRCSGYGKGLDVLMMQLYFAIDLPRDEYERIDALITPEWAFSDIDYADRSRSGWAPTIHLTRLQALTRMYTNPRCPLYRDPGLGRTVHGLLGFWLSTMPGSDNWWHAEIGTPKKMGPILLMLRDELSDEEYRLGLEVMENAKFGRTGQNKAWLAGNGLMRGLLTDDLALVREARDQMAEEICTGNDEGIQDDWSFHQHGPQMQFGNYGLAYLDGLALWSRVLSGTSLAFSAGQQDIIERYALDGLRWTVWQGMMDPSCCGRQVFIDAGRGKGFALAVAASNLALAGGRHKAELEAVARENLHPDKASNTLVGPRYFPCSDFGIFRGRDWYASVRMHSSRTIGFEFTNRENLGGWFSADGALLLMKHTHEYENIFACWDWTMVPGVTAYHDGKPLKTQRPAITNSSGLVGGKAANGVLVTSMEVDRDSLHAFKSVFMFDDLIVALGADIRTLRDGCPLTTAVEQSHLVRKGMRSGRNWAWHDGRGYLTLDGAPLHISTGVREGSWELIGPSYKGCTDSAAIFRCWIDHDVKVPGSYAYAILPDAGIARTRRMASHPDVEVISNDAEVQSIRYKGRICTVRRRDSGNSSIILEIDIAE